ncbi:MAG: nucleoside triphosphate pyrophosphohydrolase [Nitrospirae bacterium]|jgi:MazG family protein|uniref:MazG family protein n=1 Tax=Leptospirillum ferrodiazotrophum TaxID=412449 RepID=C6HVH1_9BACT|nr:MAG: MazG family protein [Leptospirillum ferrodiazotrophum]MCL5953377.1 nucleoside triphosphate pyrophosphohydrolase [Nitrospirota bacterium]
MTFDPKEYLSHIAREADHRAVPVTADPRDTTAVQTLLRIVDHLRGDNGCPFDRKQTLKGLLSDLKDEVYELEESLEDGDLHNLSREMGDVFIILFMARRILWEQTTVSLGEILDGASLKMVSRHPHVFESPDPEKSLEAIWETWEEKKRAEAVHQDRRSVLDGIPRTMPALQAASRLGQKAGRVGFDWTSNLSVLDKVEEECAEIRAALSEGSARLTEEIGDMLFAMAQFARLSGIRPEEALSEANKKFKRRFAFMEEQATREERALSSLTPEEWARLWENAKNRYDRSEGD